MKKILSTTALLLIITTGLFSQVQELQLPSSLSSGLNRIETGETDQWIKYSNNQSGSNLRSIRVLVKTVLNELVVPEDSLPGGMPIEETNTFAGVKADVDFNSGKISTITLHIDITEMYIKAYGYVTKEELENTVLELIPN